MEFKDKNKDNRYNIELTIQKETIFIEFHPFTQRVNFTMISEGIDSHVSYLRWKPRPEFVKSLWNFMFSMLDAL